MSLCRVGMIGGRFGRMSLFGKSWGRGAIISKAMCRGLLLFSSGFVGRTVFVAMFGLLGWKGRGLGGKEERCDAPRTRGLAVVLLLFADRGLISSPLFGRGVLRSRRRRFGRGGAGVQAVHQGVVLQSLPAVFVELPCESSFKLLGEGGAVASCGLGFSGRRVLAKLVRVEAVGRRGRRS